MNRAALLNAYLILAPSTAVRQRPQHRHHGRSALHGHGCHDRPAPGRLKFRLGYRNLNYDFEKGSDEFDFSMHGLLLGVGFTF